jgi:hypothetical protein
MIDDLLEAFVLFVDDTELIVKWCHPWMDDGRTLHTYKRVKSTESWRERRRRRGDGYGGEGRGRRRRRRRRRRR